MKPIQNRILLLYDPDVYRFDCNTKRQVLIKDEEIVDELNLLQFHNAESIVMFNHSSENYILDLYDRMDEVRQREKIMTTRKTENMGEFELEEAPAYQVPKTSPSLPSCTTLDRVKYRKRRPASEIEKGRQLVRAIFDEVNWASDIAVIYCIRLLEETLDL